MPLPPARLAVVVPVRETPVLAAKMREDYDRPSTAVTYKFVNDGPATIESADDVAASEAGVLRSAHEADAEGVDAIVLACFSEPGISGLDSLRTPVLGEGRPAVAAVGSIYDQFAIMSASSATVASKVDMAQQLGVSDRLVGVLPLDIPVAELRADRPDAFVRLIQEAADLGARAILLGCTGLEPGITRAVRAAVPPRLSAQIDVVDPADVARHMAIALARRGPS